MEVISLIDSTINRLTPRGSIHRENAKSIATRYGVDDSYIMKSIAGILKEIRSEYESGYIQTIQELIHADVFSDFIDMTDYLIRAC